MPVEKQNLPLCQTPMEHYIVAYPTAIEFAEEQFSIGWSEREIPVEDDMQEFFSVASEADKQAIIEILKLFTKYELEIGDNYWLDRVRKRFPRPDIKRMATMFGNVEMNMHAPFYQRLNEVLLLNTEEFYESYKQSPVLVERMRFIKSALSGEDDLLSLATFSMIEGAILYSAFAFIKHYRSGGMNLFKNVVSGIDFSVRDENLHALGGAWLFGVLKSELDIGDEYWDWLVGQIKQSADVIVLHEDEIIDRLFSFGEIVGIDADSMKKFVRSRIDNCLINLGIEPIFKIPKEENPIAMWFYRDINSYKLHDFFDTTGNQYTRDWNQHRFIWGQVES